MTHSGEHNLSGIPKAARDVMQRAIEMGLPNWYLDATGASDVHPSAHADGCDVLRSEEMIARIRACISDAEFGTREACLTLEPLPCTRLVVMPVREHRTVLGHVAVLVLIRGVRGLGDTTAALALDAEHAESTVRTLEWMCKDRTENTKLRADIEAFGRQLSDSFEEIALLNKLREGISADTNPGEFVDEACRDLLSVIPYAWTGVCFSRERRDARSLAGEAMGFGDVPCDTERFRHAIDLLSHMFTPGVPIVLSDNDRGAFATGGSQVAVVPFGKHDTIVGVLVAGGKTNNDDAVTSIEIKMLEAVAGHILVLTENAGLYAEQRDTFLGTIRALTNAIDAKDRYTCGHSERVAYMSAQLALASGMSPKDAERIRISGLVHDIGKIGVPESVLRKPGKLTDEEYDAIKLHPEIGHSILRDIPQLEDVLPGVLYHHERWDGRGYPYKLAGEKIPLMARVIGLADAFDAMSSSRTYRSAMPREKVLLEITNGAGTQFDPTLAKRFMMIDLAPYDDMVARHQALANADRERAA
ncbi:MAG: HD-GYP domain-containing protein [Planctomycetota bacterium]